MSSNAGRRAVKAAIACLCYEGLWKTHDRPQDICVEQLSKVNQQQFFYVLPKTSKKAII